MGSNNISNKNSSRSWVGQVFAVVELSGSKGIKESNCGGGRTGQPRALGSDPQTPIQACSAAEQLWVLSH